MDELNNELQTEEIQENVLPEEPETQEAAAPEEHEGAEAVTEDAAQETEMLAEDQESEEENEPHDKNVKLMSPTRMVVRRFFRSKLSVIGLIMVIGLFLFSFLGPVTYFDSEESFLRSQ